MEPNIEKACRVQVGPNRLATGAMCSSQGTLKNSKSTSQSDPRVGLYNSTLLDSYIYVCLCVRN